MKRTTITMPEHTLARLEREARRKHTSVSAVIRDCVDATFPGPDDDGPRFPGLMGIITEDLGIAAADMDDYLAEHWVDSILSHRG